MLSTNVANNIKTRLIKIRVNLQALKGISDKDMLQDEIADATIELKDLITYITEENDW